MFVEYLALISALGLSLLLACSNGNNVLKEGDKAPDFSLKSAKGTAISLSDFRGKSTVVLCSHPKDQTPGCTKEACSFRDSLQRFNLAGMPSGVYFCRLAAGEFSGTRKLTLQK